MAAGSSSQVLATTVPQLVAALKACAASCVIALSPGDWRGVTLSHIQTHATIIGQGSILHDLTVSDSSGLTFSRLELSTAGAPIGRWGAASDNWFQILHSSNIVLDSLNVHGDPRGNLNSTPSGVLVRFSTNITVRNSEFSYLHYGISFLTDEHITFENNDFHNLFDDGMRGGDTSWLTINNNFCHANHPDASDTDHPDCVQVWTSNTTTSAHDITITNNRYDRGTGHPTQFIFLGNERGVPYENVKISGNRSYGSLWNGISVITARNVVIENNDILPSCKPDAGQVITSWIMTGDINGLILQDNVAADFRERSANTNKSQGNNRKAGCLDHSPF